MITTFGRMVAALGLLAAGVAHAQAYPVAAVLDSFRAACADIRDVPAAARAATASGWTAVPDASRTPMAGLVSLARSMEAKLTKDGTVTTNPLIVLTRPVAGRQLYILLSGVTVEGSVSNGCRLYDPAATAPIARDVLIGWAGRPPVAAFVRPDYTRMTWQPGLTSADQEFEVNYISPASPFRSVVRVGGLVLVSSYVVTLAARPAAGR